MCYGRAFRSRRGFCVDTLKQVVVVPEDAVERGPNGLYAFVIGDDDKVEMRDIKVGQEGNGQSVVTAGPVAGRKGRGRGPIPVAGRLPRSQPSEARRPSRPRRRRRTPPEKAP